MPLKVQECPAAEFAHLVGIEEKAFRFDSTEDSILFPGPFPENSTEIRVKEMIKELQDDPSSIWLKVVDTDAANPNEGIAYAKWHIYKDRTVTARPSREWGQGANVEACDAFFGSMAEKMLTYVGDKNCYFLNILVTDPDHWRRGAGRMLVKWGTDQADEHGIPAYLESTEKGRPVYKNCGFDEKEVLEVDFTRWGKREPMRAWLMYYEPKTKPSS